MYLLLFNDTCSILGHTVGHQASRCQNNALRGEKAARVNSLVKSGLTECVITAKTLVQQGDGCTSIHTACCNYKGAGHSLVG